jgi:steroid 5-alpha reductase family enzyme
LKSLIIFLLISAWAFRLFFYLLKRNRNTGEDFRYQQWRKEWGEKANSIAYVRVFWLQTVLSLAIFYPVIFILYYTPADWEVFDLISLTLFVLGLVIEIVADGQKFAFKSNPANKGKLLDQGLWAFSRHPNYFGESLLWWGFFGFSLSAGTSFFNFWGPALLTFFLIKVSGVAMLEKAKENDPEYQEYRQRVSSFIPWFPKTK